MSHLWLSIHRSTTVHCFLGSIPSIKFGGNGLQVFADFTIFGNTHCQTNVSQQVLTRFTANCWRNTLLQSAYCDVEKRYCHL